MKNKIKKEAIIGVCLLALFVLWTVMVCFLDVRPVGVNGTDVGLSGLNTWFHALTGESMLLYCITDWLGLVPVVVCVCFGAIGALQLIKRRSLLKVDKDILVLGVYYIFVAFLYLLFEELPINYRPMLINGVMESSYPSSTTLLVLSVMPTLKHQVKQRCKNERFKGLVFCGVYAFSAFMVLGRLISGVHWVSDIIGSCFLCAGIYNMYKAVVAYCDKVN